MAFTARTPVHYDSASSASATVAVPTGTQDGDILFTLIAWKSIYGVGFTGIPAGWTQVGTSGSNTQGVFFLYYRIASSEPENYTWSAQYAPTYPDRLRIVTYAYSGGDFDTADPIDVVSNTAYTTGNTTVRAASMTVSAASSPMVFIGGGLYAAVATFTKPSDIGSDAWTEDDDDGGASYFSLTAASMIFSGSGATGNMDATGTQSMSVKHAFAVALNPPPPKSISAASGSFSISGTAAKLSGSRIAIAQSDGSYLSSVGTSLTLTLSGNPTPGNILFAAISYSQYAGANDITPPGNGWTQIHTRTQGNDTVDVFWREVVEGDGTGYVFVATKTEWMSGVLLEITNADLSAVVDDEATTAIASLSSPAVTGTVTPTAKGLSIATLSPDIGTTAGISVSSVDTGYSLLFSERPNYHATFLAVKYVDAATSGSFNITNASGTAVTSIVIIAEAPTSTNYSLSVNSGSFTETGTAATLKATRLLVVAVGSFAESGTAASLEYGRKIAAASGEFLESGTAAGLRVTRLLSAASGSFAETGSAATLAYEQAGILYADPGSFSLAGAIAALKYDRKLSAAGGTFEETGTAAGLRHNRKIAALPGAYTLSGTTIDFLYGRVFPVGSGAFVLTGTPATLIYVHLNQYLLDAGSGTFLISGGDVSFLARHPGASRICYVFRKRRDHFRI